MSVDRTQIEQWLFREARLMDGFCLPEWEALWTDDGVYWIPCAHDSDPFKDVSIIYADRDGITRRLGRMKSSAMYTQDPRSIISRVVSNIEIYPDGDDKVTTHSTFNVTEFKRRGRESWHYTWAGRAEHRLRRANGDWKMAYKKATLINSDGEIPPLGFLV